MLHANLVNPAFLVQLFARLLHYISARLFNGLIEEPVRVSPQWGRLLFEWIHKKLVGWAEPQGLRVAVECYLTRLSQVSCQNCTFDIEFGYGEKLMRKKIAQIIRLD